MEKEEDELICSEWAKDPLFASLTPREFKRKHNRQGSLSLTRTIDTTRLPSERSFFPSRNANASLSSLHNAQSTMAGGVSSNISGSIGSSDRNLLRHGSLPKIPFPIKSQLIEEPMLPLKRRNRKNPGELASLKAQSRKAKSLPRPKKVLDKALLLGACAVDAPPQAVSANIRGLLLDEVQECDLAQFKCLSKSFPIDY